jgi:hypothetical protein
MDDLSIVYMLFGIFASLVVIGRFVYKCVYYCHDIPILVSLERE